MQYDSRSVVNRTYLRLGQRPPPLSPKHEHTFREVILRRSCPGHPGHRCDEPLCTAEADLELGTVADNRWDTVARPYRAADLDTRGSAGRSRAIREAVLAVLATGDSNPGEIGAAARMAMRAGDPNRHQLTLWARTSG